MSCVSSGGRIGYYPLNLYIQKNKKQKEQCHFDKNTQRWLTTTDEDQIFPLPRACPSVKPPLFSISRCHWKKPNVCLLSTILTSSLPPLSLSAPPVLDVHPVSIAEPTRTAVHAAVQRQPQRPQPHKFPRLLPWGVLPAADRTDQRDGEPGGQWPDAVLREGPGVLHSGPEGKGLISYDSHSNHFSPVSTEVKSFPPYTCSRITVCLFSGFSSNTKGSREPPWSADMCSAISYHIHLFRFRHLGLVPQNDSNTAEACTQRRWCRLSYSTQSSTASYLHCGVQ